MGGEAANSVRAARNARCRYAVSLPASRRGATHYAEDADKKAGGALQRRSGRSGQKLELVFKKLMKRG